jgi:hypothetical protein
MSSCTRGRRLHKRLWSNKSQEPCTEAYTQRRLCGKQGFFRRGGATFVRANRTTNTERIQLFPGNRCYHLDPDATGVLLRVCSWIP